MSANIWGHGLPFRRCQSRQETSPEQRRLCGSALRLRSVWFACLTILSAASAWGQDVPLPVPRTSSVRAPVPGATGENAPARIPLRTASRTNDFRDPISSSDWHPTLVRDRQLETRLRMIRKELDAGRVSQGLAGLQFLLDQPQDYFVQFGEGKSPIGAHRLASRWLSTAPFDVLQTYQLLYSAEASQLLRKAMQDQDAPLLREVVRRFFCTPAGYTALDRLSSRALDLGDYALASAGFERLLTEPIHQSRLTPQLRLKAALASERSGNTHRARKLLAGLGSLPVTVGGQHLSPQLWYSRIGSTGSLPASDLRMVGGSYDRNGVSPGTPPAFGYPVWTASLSDSNSHHLDGIVAGWIEEQQHEGLPLGIAHFPLAVGGLLLFRDFEGVRAVESDTGRTVWSYDCESSLARDIPPQNATAPVEIPDQAQGRRPVRADYYRRRLGADGRGDSDSGNLGRQFVGNWAMGMLSSDGRSVFAIDQLESNWSQRGIIPGQIDDPQAVNRQTNLLVAISLQPADPAHVTPRWTIGGPAPSEEEGHRVENSRRLAGHFFMGPPLPLDGKLYAITECRQQLNLVCLRADDGEPQWQQELCALPLPVSQDASRYYLACAPAYSEGVLVCPTHSGMLAAVDPLTGELLWSSSYESTEQQQRQAAAPYLPRTRFGHPGYPNLPIVHHGRVIYLPAHSEAVCCFDLFTGKLLWRTRREDFEQAIEYVAAAEDGWVMVVGRRRCRGLSLENGSELWTVPLTSIPAGRGCRVGANYLVPLTEGTVLSLDPRTGRRMGFSLPRGESRPGNLMATGDLLISMGSRDIQAFPQAGPWLKKIAAPMASQPAYGGQLLLAAELEMAVGQTTAAQQHLQAVLDNRAASPASTPRAELLLRELLFSELTNPAADPRLDFQRLGRLVEGTNQQGRLLALESSFHHERGDISALISTARKLAALDHQELVLLDQDPARSVASGTLARRILESIRMSPQAPARLESQVAGEFAAAALARDLLRLQRLIDVYANWPAAEIANVEVARLLSRKGHDQQAELLLLKSSESRQPEVATAALCCLIDLYNEHGLYQEAGRLLQRLATRHRDHQVMVGSLEEELQANRKASVTRKPVAAILASFPRQHPAWEAYSRLMEPNLPAGLVRITENRMPNKSLHDHYNGAGMQILNTPRNLGFDLFDQGGELVSVHRHSEHEPALAVNPNSRFPQFAHFVDMGRLLIPLTLKNDAISVLEGVEPPAAQPKMGTRIKLPARHFYPIQPQQSFVGHFFPLGSPGMAHGVSLLENRESWPSPMAPPGLNSRAELVRVGPAGAGYCIFQCRQHLFSVDPGDGRLQWQRSDLEMGSGLSVDPFAGLFGDEKVLVLFAADRMHYTLYDTVSGEELRRGRLDVSRHQQPRTVGRKLFHFTNGTTGRQLRIWDPLTDEVIWQEDADQLQEVSMHAGVPSGTKVLGFVANADEFAYLTVDGRLKIIDIPTGRKRLDIAWSVGGRSVGGVPRDPGFLRVFGDAERYYVNLQQIQPPGEMPVQNSFIVSDTPLPALHVCGELAAIDRLTQQELWFREVDNCSILQFPELRLPVLVTAARVRHPSQLALRLEVIDARSGETAAVHDRLLADRLLQYSFSRQPRSLELRTAKTTIRIDLAARP